MSYEIDSLGNSQVATVVSERTLVPPVPRDGYAPLISVNRGQGADETIQPLVVAIKASDESQVVVRGANSNSVGFTINV